MGRPPLGKTAMTGAERVRRWREKHAVKKPKPDRKRDPETVQRLKARIRELEAELAKMRRHMQ